MMSILLMYLCLISKNNWLKLMCAASTQNINEKWGLIHPHQFSKQPVGRVLFAHQLQLSIVFLCNKS